MPLPNGELTPEERGHAVQWFRRMEVERLDGDLICEMCKNINWILHPFILGRDSDAPGGAVNMYRMPSIAFACSECGNTKTFLSSLVGIEPLNTLNAGGIIVDANGVVEADDGSGVLNRHPKDQD